MTVAHEIKNTCLVFVGRQGPDGEPQVLLLHKQRGPNAGLWVPPGGKVQVGETPIQAARREFEEETGLAALAWRPLGLVSQWEPPSLWLLHLVQVTRWEGAVRESEEGPLAWFGETDVAALPLPELDKALWPHWWRAMAAGLWLDVAARHDETGRLLALETQVFDWRGG